MLTDDVPFTNECWWEIAPGSLGLALNKLFIKSLLACLDWFDMIELVELADDVDDREDIGDEDEDDVDDFAEEVQERDGDVCFIGWVLFRLASSGWKSPFGFNR